MSPAEYIADRNRRIEELEKFMQKLDVDIYRGDGPRNPSMTTRLFQLEDSMRSVKWIFRLVVANLFGLVSLIVMHFMGIK